MKGLHIAAAVTLPLDFITESSAIIAKKGAGKTNAAMVMLEQAHAAGVPVVSIDPKGDHWGIRAGADGKAGGGLAIPVFGGLHGDIPLEPTAGVYLADLVRSRNLSVVLDVSEFTIGERARFLTAFADRLYRYDAKDPMLLMLEEAHEYIPQRVGGDEAKMVGAFERLVKLGRSKGLGVVMVTQRSASLNKNVLTQADNLFVMRTTSPQDRDAVKAWIDTNAGASSILAELPSLQTGECWLWQPERGEPIKFRWAMRRTYDAGATPKVGEKPRPPATLADVDLGEISKAMADTIEKAKADDPKVLRATIAELRKQIAGRPTEPVVREVEKIVEVQILTDEDRLKIAEVDGMLKGLAHVLPEYQTIRTKVAAAEKPTSAKMAPQGAASRPPARVLPRDVTLSRQTVVVDPDAEVRFRAGAQRMIEALGRMHPLRLTKSQWGTVSGMKTTSGTWSTYFGEIKRAGFLDESTVGFTLSDAGFDYLGERPEPMTAIELQDHYRRILRAGAVRMLDAIMARYPNGIDIDFLGDEIEMSTKSGTFSTYKGELIRNGLVTQDGGVLTATDILMRGAAG